MLAWGFGFWMWRLTLASGVLFLMSAEYSEVMCGFWPGTLVTWSWLHLSKIYCCPLRLWSQICDTCQSCWFPNSVTVMLCRASCLMPEGWLHAYEMVTEHFANPNLSVVVAKYWFLRFVAWDRTFMCSVFTATLTMYDRIICSDYLLLTSIKGCRAPEDVRASFLFEGDLNSITRSGGFYDDEPSWSCSLWLLNGLRLRSVGCRPNPCTWWNT